MVLSARSESFGLRLWRSKILKIVERQAGSATAALNKRASNTSHSEAEREVAGKVASTFFTTYVNTLSCENSFASSAALSKIAFRDVAWSELPTEMARS